MHQAIAKGEIHLWLAYIEPPKATLRSLWGILSDDERHQADRFHFQGDRLHYIASRGTLRCILSRYTGLTPEHLEFQYGSKGKPALSPDCNPDDLRFNLSHSHKLAFYACLLQHEIGVDIEYIKPVQDMENLARRFFSTQEYEALRSLPEQHKLEAFFNCWTRKEAYIKACGNSISQPLDKFVVSLAIGEPARLLSIDGSNAEASRWYLHGFAPAKGYVAALAVQGEKWKLLQPQWSAPGQAEPSPLASR